MTESVEVIARAATAEGVAHTGRWTSTYDKIVEIRVESHRNTVVVAMGELEGRVLQGPQLALTPAEARHLALLLSRSAGEAEGTNLAARAEA